MADRTESSSVAGEDDLAQMKLALKVAGRPVTDAQAGPVTWGVWMRKK